MLGSAFAPAQAVPAKQASRKSRQQRSRSSVSRVTAKKDDYVPGMYISQSQMELRLLEKLLKDKRKELAAYDLQLQEYMNIISQTQRNLYPGTLKSLKPSAGAISPRLASSLSIGPMKGTPQNTQEILDKILAEKKTELAKLQQEVELYKRGGSLPSGQSPMGGQGAQMVPGARSAPADDRAARIAGMSQYAQQRLAELEGIMNGELMATREQIRRNEELRLQNEAQLRANEALARELLMQKSSSMAESFAAPSDVASKISNTKAVDAAMAKAGARQPPPPPLNMPPLQVPAGAPARAAPAVKISTTPASDEAAARFRKAFAEQPSMFAVEQPQPEPATSSLDDMVAKSMATSRAAAAYTEPGLSEGDGKKRRSWGPEVVLVAAAAAVEAAVDFASNVIEDAQKPKPPGGSAQQQGGDEELKPVLYTYEELQEQKAAAQKKAAAEEPKEPLNFAKLWSQKRAKEGQ